MATALRLSFRWVWWWAIVLMAGLVQAQAQPIQVTDDRGRTVLPVSYTHLTLPTKRIV